MRKRALIVVDLNNDFMPGGALAVSGGDEVIPVVNALMGESDYDLILATQDWHPAKHVSFDHWPSHCVAGTEGAKLHEELDTSRIQVIIKKGFDIDVDSYSGFEDENGRTNGLGEVLKSRGIGEVEVVGLATDYCVKATALDAAQKYGLKTTVIMEACRGVEINEGDIEKAVSEMRDAGIGIR